MLQEQLVKKIDRDFKIKKFRKEAFARFLPHLYKKNRKKIPDLIEPGFLKRFNGLMLDAGNKEIKNIYTIVFPCEEVINRIIKLNRKQPALIITHHPLDWSTNRGFQIHPKNRLKKLADNNISVYSMHVPLDVNPNISTGRSIVNEIKLQNQKKFLKYFGGYAGYYGKVRKQGFLEFEKKAKKVFKIQQTRSSKALNWVEKVAIVPGGGGNPDFIKEAIALDCDTLLIGQWWSYHGDDLARRNNKKTEWLLKNHKINLIGCSHYATEALVMEKEMVWYFKKLGLNTAFVGQKNPWR